MNNYGCIGELKSLKSQTCEYASYSYFSRTNVRNLLAYNSNLDIHMSNNQATCKSKILTLVTGDFILKS